jgi:hypothetical protein
VRWLILSHRYLGIGIGWLLLAWCLSGFVMLYVAYPELTEDEYTRALPTLDLGECCRLTLPGGADAGDGVSDFTLRTMLGAPVLTVFDAFGRRSVIDLHTGAVLSGIGPDAARRIAEELSPPGETRARVRPLGAVDRDQWTVAGGFRGDRRLYRFALGDAAGTQWYVSSTTGALVQDTNRVERVWGRFGSVVHWIYPTLLRQRPALWSQVVIWAAVAGTFLTVFGLIIGIARYGRGARGRGSPYRGVKQWHHWLGLVFGLLTLTWVGSGLLSMNPWGLLEGEGAGLEAARLRGDTSMTWSDVERWLDGLAAADLPAATTWIETAPLGGSVYLVAHDRDGTKTRLAADGSRAAPLSEAALHEAAVRMLDGPTIVAAGLMEHDDAYYFSHHAARPLPVYRVIAGDAGRTRYYLDAATGQLLAKADRGRQWYRWLFEGVHRLDFAAPLRSRPFWDSIMLLLLVGVTGVCATGAYMGIKSLLR